MQVFSGSKWIWQNNDQKADEYVQFVDTFRVEKSESIFLNISVDSNYTVWVNGELVSFGQYPDFPYYKVYDHLDISEYVTQGNNKIAILCWYYGVGSLVYYKNKAGLIYEVVQGGRVLAASNVKVLCRVAPDYKNHMCENITGQLGFNFHYDMTGYDDWNSKVHAINGVLNDDCNSKVHAINGALNDDCNSKEHDINRALNDDCNNKEHDINGVFSVAVEVLDMPGSFYLRPVKKLLLEERANAGIISQGTFQLVEDTQSLSEQLENTQSVSQSVENTRKSVSLQKAGLFFEELLEMSGKRENHLPESEIKLTSHKNQGIYFIVDLGREECGFLDLEICVNQKANIDISFGEHLTDGRVRSAIGPRNFNCTYIAKEGWQHYVNTFRRLGARYLQFFVHSKEIIIKYAGIRPVTYPVKVNSFNFNNKLKNDIYLTGIRTLQLCMHEHYEDCPWREQALYTMDSRNQMLCGYYAFSESEFARASLKLIGLGQREDGLLSLCTPSGWDFPIPFFSIMYIIQMDEYINYTGDSSLARENYTILKKILSVFIDKISNNGLVTNFKESTYWNFYEWINGLDGFYTNENGEHLQDNRFSYDAILNAFVSLGLEHMSYISQRVGDMNQSEYYTKLKIALNKSIFHIFYDKGKGLFKSFIGKNEELYSVLANSLCILCGACPEEYTDYICKTIVEKDPVLVKNTLSMNVFCFDALLKVNRNLYAPFVLKEIDEVYGHMLYHGATTFWETILGESDFGGAGSLCHGWSAIPVYYYHILKDYI